MRLINIGLGEIADRLTILALKIAHAEQAGKDATHFTTERAALSTKLNGMTINTPAMEAILTLATVNGMLWRAEDEIRDWRKRFDLKAVSEVEDPAAHHLISLVAFRIQALNDQRADLVRTLNQIAGTDLGPEKL